MKLCAHWIRDFVDLGVDDGKLAGGLTEIGFSVEGISGSGADTVFEVEIGTNRPDAMNHYGMAREAAAVFDRELKAIEPKLQQSAQNDGGSDNSAAKPVKRKPISAAKAASGRGQRDAALKGRSSTSRESSSLALKRAGSASERPGTGLQSSSVTAQTLGYKSQSTDAAFPITVEEPDLCPRFTARVIRNSEIKASPENIAHRLQLLDQRPISNAVDATNYVLWEIGKPTHVFDMDLLEGGQIIVRKAREGEILKTLDGVVRKLTSEDLVVADAKKPVGLAGIMGGYDTMITDRTRNILIESAWWDPITIRKGSRRHALHTDASHRFERGADFESTALSCDLVAELILNSGGGDLGGLIDVVSKKMDQAPIVLHLSEVHRILGRTVDAGEIFRILKKLGFTVIPEGEADQEFRVHIPSWRLDVEREIDLIEEIARLHGYNKFPNTLPSYSGAVIELPDAAKDAIFRQRSLALGYNEAVSLTFISHADGERFSSAKVLELANPQSEEASVMRTSLVPGMLDMLAWNLNRDSDNARLFEMGPVYELSGNERIEPKRACLGATLTAVQSALPAKALLDVSKGEHAAAAEAFRSFKGDVENLLDTFEHRTLSFDRQASDYYHPGRSARALLDGAVVAQFGQVHPEVAAARKLRQDVCLAEFDLEQLYKYGLRQARFTPLPKYPAVERDFSFIFSDQVTFEQMRNAVAALRIEELRDFQPAEIFRGGSIPAGKYSILLRGRFQSSERTLREDEIAQWSAKIVSALEALGGTQRA